MMVKGKPKEDPDENELRRSLLSGESRCWLLTARVRKSGHTPARRHLPSHESEQYRGNTPHLRSPIPVANRLQRPLRCGCEYLATARRIHRVRRLVSGATFRMVVPSFIAASRNYVKGGSMKDEWTVSQQGLLADPKQTRAQRNVVCAQRIYFHLRPFLCAPRSHPHHVPNLKVIEST